MVGDELEGLVSFVEVDVVEGVLSTSLILSLSMGLEGKGEGLVDVESEGKAMFGEEWMGWSSSTDMLVVVIAVMVFALLS